MTSVVQSLLEIAAQLLPPDERESALGDLEEANETAWHALLDVLSLVLHRQAMLWKHWRPWVAAFLLTAPNSFLLMGVSVSVSLKFARLTAHNLPDGAGPAMLHDLVYLLCQLLLLLACSWSGGFVAASVSRRTVWATAAFCALPCLLCSITFRIESLSRVSLLLFLLPAILGVRRGLRAAQIKLSFAIMLALATTVLMIAASSSRDSRVLSLAILWPAWYLVAAARKSGSQNECLYH